VLKNKEKNQKNLALMWDPNFPLVLLKPVENELYEAVSHD